ncbi:MAG: hypothetical protein IJT02_08195 [Synergistaceae bacterium]|nr:hypothetical protein [Synergistaceae bacterium]
MKLSEDQRQSLITSLLGFVRRVSFHGADSPEEALGFPNIVGLLLGESWLFDTEGSPAFVQVEDAESDCVQESENSGTGLSRECGCRRCFECTE